MQLSAGGVVSTHEQRGITQTNILLISVCIVGALLLALLGFMQLFKPGPTGMQAVAETYVTALFHGNAAVTYALNTSDYQQRVGQSDWSQFVALNYKDYRGTTPVYLKTEPVYDPSSAYSASANPQQVIYQTILDHVTYNVTMILVMSGNSWKIDNVEVDKA